MENIDTKQIDLMNASMIFARALSLIFKDAQGIVVDLNEEINLGEDVKKVIVYKKDDMMHIYKCDEDFTEGTNLQLEVGGEE